MKNIIRNIVNEEINKQLLREYSNPDLGSKLYGIVNALDEIYSEIYNDAKARKAQGENVSENEFDVQELGRCIVPLKKLVNRMM